MNILMVYQNECYIRAPHSETQPMKKFLLLASMMRVQALRKASSNVELQVIAFK